MVTVLLCSPDQGRSTLRLNPVSGSTVTMATEADSPSNPVSPVSLDDHGLWMTLDLLRPDPPPRSTSGAPCAVDDEPVDDVFLPPSPPQCAAPPPGGATPAAKTPVHDGGVSCAFGGTGEVTEAEGNPPGLGLHPAERQTEAEHSEAAGVDEVTGSERQQDPKRDPEEPEEPESMETQTRREEEDSNASQGMECMITAGGNGTLLQTSGNASEEPHSPDTAGNRSEDPEEGSGSRSCRTGEKISTMRDSDEECKVSNSPPSDLEYGQEEDDNGDVLHSGQAKEVVKKLTQSTGDCEDTGSVAAHTHSHNSSNAGIAGHNCLASNVTDLISIVTAQDEKHLPERHLVDILMEVPDVLVAEVTREVEDRIDIRPLDYGTTAKDRRVRRESASSDTLPSFPTNLAVQSFIDGLTEHLLRSPEPEGGEAQLDGSGAISSVIQQGELLLQRLQWVQDRQDTQEPPSTRQPAGVSVNQTSSEGEEWEVARGVLWNEGENLRAECEGGAVEEEAKVEHRSNLVEEDGQREGQAKSKRREESDNEEVTSALSVDPTAGIRPQHRVPGLEDIKDDDQRDHGGLSADFPPIYNQEQSTITVVPSTAETFVAEIREIDQHLQKARLLFKLTDNPDVLEIPFKTPILLKWPQGEETGTAQSLALQFSEQKMHKETRQEHQRELAQVNQGAEFHKEATRQLKETKRLFEGDGQGSTKGVVRLSRTPITDPVYPSMLERTRSLEGLSPWSEAVCRTESLRVPRPVGTERGRRWERCISRSPVAGTSSYPTWDQHLRHHRSMVSLNVDAPASNQGSWNKTHGPEAFLAENPFFKLRPVLSCQPEVQKDIQEARERDEELRRQRCTLYGESREPQEEEHSTAAAHGAADARQQSRGKLDRIWPPPPRPDEQSSGQTQGSGAPRPGGHVTGLWQRWEAATSPGPNTDRS
ncbi:hypothetical protein NHX12_031804 [Muraenolepis orangiensis]|uniref:Uncharacterized protein n=1 Tax=Muraenolepis orangiensis TaxID=630683 RepID=A0A9Q0E4G6_9TELE|nr:hypothetical protein NHX12_031804 [Muraenolepis orangiensis]